MDALGQIVLEPLGAKPETVRRVLVTKRPRAVMQVSQQKLTAP